MFAKKFDSSADYRILNYFDTHPRSHGLHHSKHNIDNVAIRPVQEKMAVLFFTLMVHLHKRHWIWLVVHSTPNLIGVTYIHFSHSLTLYKYSLIHSQHTTDLSTKKYFLKNNSTRTLKTKLKKKKRSQFKLKPRNAFKW